MQVLIVVLLAVHVLAGVFWAGSTFALAHSGDSGSDLFPSQMGAAALSAGAGAALWALLHGGPPTGMEKTLAAGALCAVLAAVAQGTLRKSSPRLSHRIAAVLLSITVVCMTVARYAP